MEHIFSRNCKHTMNEKEKIKPDLISAIAPKDVTEKTIYHEIEVLIHKYVPQVTA